MNNPPRFKVGDLVLRTGCMIDYVLITKVSQILDSEDWHWRYEAFWLSGNQVLSNIWMNDNAIILAKCE